MSVIVPVVRNQNQLALGAARADARKRRNRFIMWVVSLGIIAFAIYVVVTKPDWIYKNGDDEGETTGPGDDDGGTSGPPGPIIDFTLPGSVDDDSSSSKSLGDVMASMVWGYILLLFLLMLTIGLGSRFGNGRSETVFSMIKGFNQFGLSSWVIAIAVIMIFAGALSGAEVAVGLGIFTLISGLLLQLVLRHLFKKSKAERVEEWNQARDDYLLQVQAMTGIDESQREKLIDSLYGSDLADFALQQKQIKAAKDVQEKWYLMTPLLRQWYYGKPTFDENTLKELDYNTDLAPFTSAKQNTSWLFKLNENALWWYNEMAISELAKKAVEEKAALAGTELDYVIDQLLAKEAGDRESDFAIESLQTLEKDAIEKKRQEGLALHTREKREHRK